MQKWHHLLLGLLLNIVSIAQASDYDFDIGDYDKKPWQFGGYINYVPEYQALDNNASFYTLNFYGTGLTANQRQQFQAEFNGSYSWNQSSINFIGHGLLLQDNLGYSNALDIYEFYYANQANIHSRYEIGKRTLKWGKGYSWNPVGFIEREKDPLQPELNREGYTIAAYDYVKSGGQKLRTWGLNMVFLPVNQHLNTDYGRQDNYLAAKLYFLYLNNDIDFLLMAGNNTAARYGFDFSRNLSTNFEIHAEWAKTLNYERPIIQSDLSLSNELVNVDTWLIGMRYLTNSNLTLILERFYNGGGYSTTQMQYFYSQVSSATLPADLAALRAASAAGYGGVFAMRNYVYVRLIQKEPFGLIHWTPTLTLIQNLDDLSQNLGLDINYIGIDNLELHMRVNRLIGNSQTEYGEKPTDLRLSFEARYYY